MDLSAVLLRVYSLFPLNRCRRLRSNIIHHAVDTWNLVHDTVGDACQQVLKLLAKLEMPGLSERQVDDLLGDLSAQILHIHEHTRDLDKTVIRGGR